MAKPSKASPASILGVINGLSVFHSFFLLSLPFSMQANTSKQKLRLEKTLDRKCFLTETEREENWRTKRPAGCTTFFCFNRPRRRKRPQHHLLSHTKYVYVHKRVKTEPTYLTRAQEVYYLEIFASRVTGFSKAFNPRSDECCRRKQ